MQLHNRDACLETYLIAIFFLTSICKSGLCVPFLFTVLLEKNSLFLRAVLLEAEGAGVDEPDDLVDDVRGAPGQQAPVLRAVLEAGQPEQALPPPVQAPGRVQAPHPALGVSGVGVAGVAAHQHQVPFPDQGERGAAASWGVELDDRRHRWRHDGAPHKASRGAREPCPLHRVQIEVEGGGGGALIIFREQQQSLTYHQS